MPQPSLDVNIVQFNIFDHLNGMPTLEERIELLFAIDLTMIPNPDIVLRYFDIVQTYSDAQDVARAFFTLFGPIAICREVSRYDMRMTTLLDEIVNYGIQLFNGSNCYLLIILAFQEIGFKRGAECSIQDLRNEYCKDPSIHLV